MHQSNSPYRKTAIPPLQDNEYIILQSQGGYRLSYRTGWRPVECFLTNRRLIFFLRPLIRFQVPIENIRKLDVEKHYYVLKTREALRITYEGVNGSRGGKVLLITNSLPLWKKNIHQLCFLKIDIETIQRISDQLDSDSREILWYLWENRHARINRLAEVIDAPNHIHVLSVIRETINPISEKLVGCPILSFERKRIDSEAGETVTFSWWMIGKKERFVPNEQRLVDIFDEGAQIRVIMEVRGVETGDLKLDFDKDRVTVRCHKIGASLREKLDLPHEVSPEDYDMHIRNNLLEIKLLKIED
jgi:HSP20 family molecular chaperone IbpA